MISIYEVFTDKYGDYYVSYNKKHRIKTIEKNNEKIQNDIDKLFAIAFRDGMAYSYMKRLEDMLVKYKIYNRNGKRYIKFGG